MSSSWSENKQGAYPDDFLPGSGMPSMVSPRKTVNSKKWKPSTPVESQKVGEWLGGAPPGQKVTRSYVIKREIPAPTL